MIVIHRKCLFNPSMDRERNNNTSQVSDIEGEKAVKKQMMYGNNH